MAAVTVSPKYQVVIPKDVRNELGLVPGQKMQVMTYMNRIELIPLKPMKELKGFLPDLETNVDRDPDRL
jgi:AbrB family looped-hinge helix DNA binding protein